MKKFFIVFALLFTINRAQCDTPQELQNEITRLEKLRKENQEKIAASIQNVLQGFYEKHKECLIQLLERHERQCKINHKSSECQQIFDELEIRKEYRETFEKQIQDEVQNSTLAKYNQQITQKILQLKMQFLSSLNVEMIKKTFEELDAGLNDKSEALIQPLKTAIEKFEENHKYKEKLRQSFNQYALECNKNYNSEECNRAITEWTKMKKHTALFEEFIRAESNSLNLTLVKDNGELFQKMGDLAEYIMVDEQLQNNA
jgi:hypothetical protein